MPYLKESHQNEEAITLVLLLREHDGKGQLGKCRLGEPDWAVGCRWLCDVNLGIRGGWCWSHGIGDVVPVSRRACAARGRLTVVSRRIWLAVEWFVHQRVSDKAKVR
jgi:hypothetical protein